MKDAGECKMFGGNSRTSVPEKGRCELGSIKWEFSSGAGRERQAGKSKEKEQVDSPESLWQVIFQRLNLGCGKRADCRRSMLIDANTLLIIRW